MCAILCNKYYFTCIHVFCCHNDQAFSMLPWLMIMFQNKFPFYGTRKYYLTLHRLWVRAMKYACTGKGTSLRSVRLLISSSSVLVQSADFSQKMQPKLLLPPVSSLAWLLQLSPHKHTQFCHPTCPESSKLCCKTHPHGTLSSPLYTSPAKAALATPVRAHLSERIKYKVACMCFHVINGSSPTYLFELLHVCTPSCTIPACSKSHNTNTKLMAFALSLTFDPVFGIHSHTTSGNAQLFHLLKWNWKLSFFHSISIPANFSSHFSHHKLYSWMCGCVNAS